MSERISITEGRKILRDQATEAEIQSAIVDYLNVQKIPHTVTEAKRSYNERGQLVRRIAPGWPDITGAVPIGLGSQLCAAFLGIECKSASGRLRPDQARTLYGLYKAGALVVVARSVDDVVELLLSGRVRDCDVAEMCKYKDRIQKRKR
jgi:hypothetical protein